MAYVAGTDLTFEIALIDASGASIDAASVEYRVVDGDGAVILSWTALTGFTAGSDATVTIPATYNALPVGAVKAAREIELRCTLADGSKKIAVRFYVIESDTGPIVRGRNSMVTLAGAELLALDLPNMTAWSKATRDQKAAALTEGFRRLTKMRLIYLDCYAYDVTRPFARERMGSLADLSQSEILALDAKMAVALAMGQVSEADWLLSDDGTESKRESGLILDTIGEVKQMYRSQKPLSLPVCRRTISLVSDYMTIGSKVIGRN